MTPTPVTTASKVCRTENYQAGARLTIK